MVHQFLKLGFNRRAAYRGWVSSSALAAALAGIGPGPGVIGASGG
jgi:hypothetical protein